MTTPSPIEAARMALGGLLEGFDRYIAGAGPMNECLSVEDFRRARDAYNALTKEGEHDAEVVDELARPSNDLRSGRLGAKDSILDAAIRPGGVIPSTVAAPAGWKPAEGIYVASRASLPERGEMWRQYRAAGVPINSTWIDEDGPKASRDLADLWRRILRETTTAKFLVLYAEPDDFPLKGALIEVGMALAANVPIRIVAPGVEIEERNCRPLGSWIKHPLVSFWPTVQEALYAPAETRRVSPPIPEGIEALVAEVRKRLELKESIFEADIDLFARLADALEALDRSPLP